MTGVEAETHQCSPAFLHPAACRGARSPPRGDHDLNRCGRGADTPPDQESQARIADARAPDSG